MIVLFGQASYAGEDLSAEERDFISRFTEALCDAVESQLPGTVEYRPSNSKLNDFELDRALNLSIGSLKLQRLLIEHDAKVVLERLLIEDSKVVIEKRPKQPGPMGHSWDIFATTFVGNVALAFVTFITKGSVDLDRAIFVQIALPILAPESAPERGAEEPLWYFFGRVALDYVGRSAVFVVTAFGCNYAAAAIYPMIVAPVFVPVAQPLAAAAA